MIKKWKENTTFNALPVIFLYCRNSKRRLWWVLKEFDRADKENENVNIPKSSDECLKNPF